MRSNDHQQKKLKYVCLFLSQSHKQINQEETMLKSTQNVYASTNQLHRHLNMQGKPKYQNLSYSILKRLKQNSSPIHSKLQSHILKPQGLKVLFADIELKNLYQTKQVSKTSLNQLSIKQKAEEKTQTKPNKIIVSIQDYAIKNISDSLNKRYIYELYRGVKYSLQKLKPPSKQHLKELQIQILQPTVAKDKFLFLDLDQTLIFTQKLSNQNSDNTASYKVSIRPYTYTFLEQLSPYYEIFVFTAAVKGYAEAAISKLNKKYPYIKDYLSREQCIKTKKGRYIKDLRVIKNRQLKDIVIVDNMVQSFGLQLDNGIPIVSFDGYTKDEQLLKLISFLKKISKQADVRPFIRQRFQLQKILSIEKDSLNQYLGFKVI